MAPDRRFTSIGEALEELRPDAAVVCTPNETHAALARQILGAGVHLLIEKPLAEDWAEAKAIVALADDTGRQLAVAQQYRYRSGFPALRQAVVEGRLGLLTAGLVQFYRWRPTKGMSCPSCSTRRSTTSTSCAICRRRSRLGHRAALGSRRGTAPTGPPAPKRRFSFRTACGSITAAATSPRGARRRLTPCGGSRGVRVSCVMDGDESVVLHRREAVRRSFGASRERGAPRSASARTFSSRSSTGRPCPTHGADNLRTLAMVFAVEKSAREGRTVTLEELFEPRGLIDVTQLMSRQAYCRQLDKGQEELAQLGK